MKGEAEGRCRKEGGHHTMRRACEEVDKRGGEKQEETRRKREAKVCTTI